MLVDLLAKLTVTIRGAHAAGEPTADDIENRPAIRLAAPAFQRSRSPGTGLKRTNVL
jgi:hypothetical protein